MTSCLAAVMTDAGDGAFGPVGRGCGRDCAQAAGAASTSPSEPPNAAC